MIFANPVKGTIHVSAVFYPADPDAWKRPAGNVDFAVTQEFGPTALAVEPPMVWPGGEDIPAGSYPHFHRGIDLGNGQCGGDILAMAVGKVVEANINAARGKYLVIDHGSGFKTEYQHLANAFVSLGQSVTEGQRIGAVGTTGQSTACHLHCEVWKNGAIVDPYRRLRQNTSVDPDAPPVVTYTQAQLDAAVLAAKQAQYDLDAASVKLTSARPT